MKEGSKIILAWAFIGVILLIFGLIYWVWVSVGNRGFWYQYGDYVVPGMFILEFAILVLVTLFRTIKYWIKLIKLRHSKDIKEAINEEGI